MKPCGSFWLVATLVLIGLPLATGSQEPPDSSIKVPKIVFDSETRKTSEGAAIQPPNMFGSQCTNRIEPDRPMTVAELAGQTQYPVRDIRVRRYFSGDPPTSERATSEMLAKVWQSKFDSAECFQTWDVGNFWSISAAIEYFIGAPGELITDGSDVYIKDHDGKTWFLRLLPAAQ
jgi:hypothetical protein